MLENIKGKSIYLFAYGYLLLSILLFVLGWCKPIVSIPVCIILLIAFLKTVQNMPKTIITLKEHKKKFIVIGFLLLGWLLLSGVGGFTWQNEWDHMFRNAIFKDLYHYSWPVINTQGSIPLTFCYYLGFWLPSALVGKVFQNIEIGYIFQILWAFVGIFIAFCLICQWLKKVKIRHAIIFILFSGLDVFLYILFNNFGILQELTKIASGIHMELATTFFNSSSNTTLLFWLYNQTIPFWIGMMLLLLQKNNKSLIFTYSLLFLYAPFPTVALMPVIVYLFFKNYSSQKTNKQEAFYRIILRKVLTGLTMQNVASLLIFLLVGTFFMSNNSANQMSFIPLNMKNIITYVLHFVLEYGIYLILIYKTNKKDMVLKILLITTVILSFIKLGNSYDFAWRTCIPFAFYIMLLVMKEFTLSSMNKVKRILLITVLLIGMITPLTEFIRSINGNYRAIRYDEPTRSDTLDSVFIDNPCYDNFIGNTDSIFFRYFAKK